MAVGASYPETGGKNVSGLHWDMIKNMKTILRFMPTTNSSMKTENLLYDCKKFF